MPNDELRDAADHYDYRRQADRLIQHIRQQGYFVTEKDPTPEERQRHALIARVNRRSGYNAERTSMSLPISAAVIDAVQSVSDPPVVKMPTLDGSLPLYVLKEVLDSPTIIVPIANYDNNQHAENENLRMQNLWDGIEIMAAIMTMPPQKLSKASR